MKVYILIVKRFFTQNGTDYAFALDSDEISVCNSYQMAAKGRESKVAYAQNEHKDKCVLSKHNDDCGDYWELSLKNYRIIYEICEKFVW